MNITVIGAGIAGLACAVALTRAGHAVTVRERHADLHAGGGGMVLWPNAGFVLDQLGLLDAVAAASGVPAAMERRNRAGERLQALDIGLLDRAMGYPSHAILRRDLVRILAGWLAQHGVPVHFGSQELPLDDGADLVIGADGRMHSLARRHVTGENAPRFQGFVNWVGAYEGPEDLVATPGITDYWGAGERFGVVAVTPRKLYWAAAVAAPDLATLPAFDALHERFHDWPGAVPALLRGTPRAQVRLIPVHDVDPVACWHRDKVLMVGDAAHASLPTSGQGAAQALEDAWHLPRCLAAHDELDAALAAFTALRAPKTQAQTLAARGFAQDLFMMDEDACRERDARAREVNTAQLVAGMARGWGQGLPLPVAA